MTDHDDRIALTAFIVGSVLAGGNAVCVRLSNRELDPFWGATLRFTLAAALMLGVMALTRRRFPTGRALVGAVIYGLLGFGGAFAFAFYALVELEAGFGQIILSLVPLITVVLAALQGQERITRARVVGSVLALAGVVLMSGWSLEGAIPIPSILASVGSAVCFAQASLTVRRYPKIDPVVLNAVGMSAGAALLALITVAAGDEISLPSQTETWAAMAYMVIIGSGIVFTLYVVLLRFWEASRANYSFVLIPPLTILVSAWILDEGIDAGLAVGGVLVLLGVYVGALRTRSTLEPQTAED